MGNDRRGLIDRNDGRTAIVATPVIEEGNKGGYMRGGRIVYCDCIYMYCFNFFCIGLTWRWATRVGVFAVIESRYKPYEQACEQAD